MLLAVGCERGKILGGNYSAIMQRPYLEENENPRIGGIWRLQVRVISR